MDKAYYKIKGQNNFTSVLYTLLILVGYWLVFFFEILIKNKIYFFGDIAYFFLPVHQVFAEALKQGKSPLWTTQIFSGFPLLAEGQTACFYPLNILFHFLFVNEYAVSLLVVFHFLMAGLFTYLYARQIGLEETSALLAGVVFAFGAFFTTHLMHLGIVFSGVWLPLGLYFIERYFQDKKIVFLVWWSLVMALQILAGHPQIVFYSGIAYLLYFIWFWSREQLSVRTLIYFGLLLGLGMSLAAIQLIPLKELSVESIRLQDAGKDFGTTFSFPLRNLITFIFPNFFGVQSPTLNSHYYGPPHYWELACYVGVVPFVLALVAISFRLTRHIKYFVMLFFVALLLSFGKYFPVYKLMQIIPGWSYFRCPARFIFLEFFSLAILAGFGFKILLLKKESYTLVLKRIYIWIGSVLLLVFGIGSLLVVLGKERLAQMGGVLLKIFGGFFSKHPDYYQVKIALWADRVVAGFQYSLNIFNMHLYVQIIILFLVYWIIKEFLHGQIKTRIFQIFLIGLVLADLYYFGARYNAPVEKTQLLPPLKLWQVFKKDKTPFRIYHYHIPRRHEVVSPEEYFVPNINMLWQVDELGGYSPMELSFMQQALVEIETQDIKTALPVLGQMNVKYIVTASPVFSAALKEVFRGAQIYVYENSFFKERAYFRKNNLAQAKLYYYNDQQVKILTDNNQPDTLILSETYYPGWEVFVDGKKTTIEKFRNIYRQIKIPAGRHEVIFSYHPKSFSTGIMISLIAALIFLSLLIFNYCGIKKQIKIRGVK